MPKFNKQYFQQPIAQGETKMAIAELVVISTQLQPKSIITEVHHLAARWSEWERQSCMRATTQDQLDLSKRQIDQSFLQLLDHIQSFQTAQPTRRFWMRFATVVAVLSGIVTKTIPINTILDKETIAITTPPAPSTKQNKRLQSEKLICRRPIGYCDV